MWLKGEAKRSKEQPSQKGLISHLAGGKWGTTEGLSRGTACSDLCFENMMGISVRARRKDEPQGHYKDI